MDLRKDFIRFLKEGEGFMFFPSARNSFIFREDHFLPWKIESPRYQKEFDREIRVLADGIREYYPNSYSLADNKNFLVCMNMARNTLGKTVAVYDVSNFLNIMFACLFNAEEEEINLGLKRYFEKTGLDYATLKCALCWNLESFCGRIKIKDFSLIHPRFDELFDLLVNKFGLGFVKIGGCTFHCETPCELISVAFRYYIFRMQELILNDTLRYLCDVSSPSMLEIQSKGHTNIVVTSSAKPSDLRRNLKPLTFTYHGKTYESRPLVCRDIFLVQYMLDIILREDFYAKVD